MSMTIRYPNGQAVTYNDAGYLVREIHSWSLYTDSSRSRWIASVQLSAGAIIEGTYPCVIENPLTERTESSAEGMVLRMYEQGRHKQGARAVRIKRALRRFDMRTWLWSKDKP